MTGEHDRITGSGSLGLSTSSRGLPPEDSSDALLGLAAYHDLALQVARMASFDVDGITGVLSWSPSAAAVIGCDPEEVDAHLRHLLAPIVATPGSLRADYELDHHLRTRGGERFIQVRARAWPSGQRPRRVGLFGVISDVTDQRRAERDVVDLIDRYRLLVELSPDAIAVHEGGVVRYVNAAACAMARTAAETVVGTGILGWVQPDDIDDMLVRLQGLTEPGMSAGPALATLQDTEGNRVKVEVMSVRTTWEGRPAFQVIMRDMAERDRAQAALRSQAQLVAAVSDAIIAFDDQHRITSWNPAAERIFGWTAIEATGRTTVQLADPFVIEGGAGLHTRLQRDGAWSGELTVACADGSHVPVHASFSAMTSDAHGADGVVAVFSDQSERRAAEAERARAEARFSTVVAALDEGIAVLGTDGRLQSFNGAAERILGRQAAGELAPGLVSGEGLDARDNAGAVVAGAEWPVQQVLAGGEAVRDRTIGIRRPDGSFVWLRMNVHPLRTGGSTEALSGVVCSFVDITQHRRAALELAHAASHDALTGLANRDAMRTEITNALTRAGSSGPHPPVSVLFCDLDRFKEVNDSLGHPVGDEILRTVAERIRRRTPAGTSVGRLGGDEFIVVTADLSEAAAIDLARDLVDALCEPLEVLVHGTTMQVTVGASVGVASTGADRPQLADSTDLLRAADVALYRAKARGRNRVEVYDPTIADPTRLRLETREDLRVAIETGQLEVHYQPLWRASADPSACTLAGFEALARWTHPVRGPQSPAEFIPLAEETGLIDALGAYVLHRACEQMARWREQGRDLYVSVNLSARQVSDPTLVPKVRGALVASGLPAEALWLELTETALADEVTDIGAVLRELSDLGVRISIDDFGTGYSSLGRLRHLPISALKIDRSFVADMTEATAPDGCGDGGVIVESTIALAHRLGLKVIAEGVETAGQLAGLAALDCEVVQGFLLGRPAAAGCDLPVVVAGT